MSLKEPTVEGARRCTGTRLVGVNLEGVTRTPLGKVHWQARCQICGRTVGATKIGLMRPHLVYPTPPAAAGVEEPARATS